MSNIEQKLKVIAGLGAGDALYPREAATILRALDVLHRVADNMCTNPTQEARDICAQLIDL